MLDITMCVNTLCPLRDECYRYKATPSIYQSYAEFPYNPRTGCREFIPLEKKEEKK